MALLHIVVLALVQGITEFLPISSSAHLILVPRFTDWPDQGLAMDVAVHVGTLLAVMLYFWRDLVFMVSGLWRLTKGKRDPGAKLSFQIVVATIPVVIAGLLFSKFVPDGLRSIEVIAWATLGFGVLLFVTDKIGMTIRRIEHLTYMDAIIIGLAQVLALIPGTSRSGITMTAARLLGFERAESARFSMLMSIPTIMAAGILIGKKIYESGDTQLTSDAIMAGGLAFSSALLIIFFMMAWLKRASFTPFVIYRLLLGGALLTVVYGVI